MSGRLCLFSSKIERDAAFPTGIPGTLRTGITGVGLVDAGIMTIELVRQYEPEEIVYLGTCGAYPGSGFVIGDVIAGTSVRTGSGDVVRGEMRIPKLLPNELKCAPELTDRLAGENGTVLKRGRVVCTLGVTEDDSLAKTLAGSGQVENLELFSVLRAAGAVPVAALLGVTNIVGEGGGRDWAANFPRMMGLLGRHVR